VHNTDAAQKYIVCNVDEGDSGTYSDRMTMEGDPFMLIEGMTIAALAVGATRGYVYIRSEYPHAVATMRHAIVLANEAGFLGADVLGSGRAFHLDVRKATGSYVCGEETAMLESLEGKRGIVRAEPPLPAIQGLFGKPTVINNVITLASVPLILARGATFYRDYGPTRSRHGDLFIARGYSVIETCRRQGRDAFDYMQQALTAWLHNVATPSLVPAALPSE